MEDHITARTPTRAGVATAFSAARPTSGEQIAHAIRRLTSEPVAKAAQDTALAARSRFGPDDTLEAVAGACLRR